MFILKAPKRISIRPRVTVCGSFNRHMRELLLAIEELSDHGAVVLSPQHSAIQGEIGKGFLLLEGDMPYIRSNSYNPIREIEEQHLRCIHRSDFIFVVIPGGYIGISTAFEIGTAIASEVPIYSLMRPLDDHIFVFVTVVPSIELAVQNHRIPILTA